MSFRYSYIRGRKEPEGFIDGRWWKIVFYNALIIDVATKFSTFIKADRPKDFELTIAMMD